ncbi:MAG: TrpB-like pyridoxal phosphate-dependent enzyme [Pirellulales bacterium]
MAALLSEHSQTILKRATLSESDLPAAWYNLAADLPEPLPPPLHPVTRKPLSAADLEPLLSRALIEQELGTERWIEIPDEVREKLAIWRPTPLVRATGLERELKTPARIYFKDESQSPPGSHKLNTAVPQAYYSQREGARRLTTETGAGQWGCSLALACSFFGLDCKVFMVNLSFRQKPYRRSMMQLWNAKVSASPSAETQAGQKLRDADPESPGSIGMAIGEAVETALGDGDTHYSMGSVFNHVMCHQTIIGLETQRQFELMDDSPDVVIGCIGGGSNFAGLAFPYVRQRLGGRPIRFVAAEPRACPTLSRGQYRYDFMDSAGLTPLVKMYTLGHDFVPPSILAGGLRYHGVSPMVSLLAHLGLIELAVFHQAECVEAARLFACTEGIVPALETAYAVRAAIVEAERCRRSGEEKCIVLSFSGHGLCDLGSYDQCFQTAVNETEPR